MDKSIYDLDREFAARCMRIYQAILPYDKDIEYLKSSYVLIKERHGSDWWIIMGRHIDVFAKFDHEPTDKEIHNAICEHFGLYHKMIYGA